MMISAVGRKKNTAASTHKLMDDVPLCAAAAIQRGPSTAAMLNSSTSQKPMARRNCDCGAAVSSAIHSFPIVAKCGCNERHHSILPGQIEKPPRYGWRMELVVLNQRVRVGAWVGRTDWGQKRKLFLYLSSVRNGGCGDIFLKKYFCARFSAGPATKMVMRPML